ncbi:MAG: hypothetical protein ACOCP4_03850 [Candidatus Woesearchaeota archaeon]|uniref:Uncharacterized protein n=1 Tax=Arfiviricetes sp. TaxID=2832556 RepID=A0AB39A3B6_9VIRU
MNYFEIIFKIKNALVNFGTFIMDFMFSDIHIGTEDNIHIGWKILSPILEPISRTIDSVGLNISFTPFELISGVGLMTILILVITKKVVPVA